MGRVVRRCGHRPEPDGTSGHSCRRTSFLCRSGVTALPRTTGTRISTANWVASPKRSRRYLSLRSRISASVKVRTTPSTPRENIPLQTVQVRADIVWIYKPREQSYVLDESEVLVEQRLELLVGAWDLEGVAFLDFLGLRPLLDREPVRSIICWMAGFRLLPPRITTCLFRSSGFPKSLSNIKRTSQVGLSMRTCPNNSIRASGRRNAGAPCSSGSSGPRTGTPCSPACRRRSGSPRPLGTTR